MGKMELCEIFRNAMKRGFELCEGKSPSLNELIKIESITLTLLDNDKFNEVLRISEIPPLYRIPILKLHSRISKLYSYTTTTSYHESVLQCIMFLCR